MRGKHDTSFLPQLAVGVLLAGVIAAIIYSGNVNCEKRIIENQLYQYKKIPTNKEQPTRTKQ